MLGLSAEAAQSAWAARVRANREQVERVREANDADFYAPVASLFRADHHRADDPTLETLRSLVRPDDVVLDVGAGAGRYALPLALAVREVIALDPSTAMLAVLRDEIARHAIANVRVIQARWPMAEAAPGADVALIAHVGYDVEEIGPFLDALEGAAGRACVAVLMDRPPPAALDALWPEIHGEPRASLPALPELLTVLLLRGRIPEVRLVDRLIQSVDSFEGLLTRARHLLWVQPDGEKDRRLQRLLQATVRQQDGRFTLPAPPARVVVVSWQPRAASEQPATSPSA